MNRMVVKSRVGADGVLRVTVPVDVADANSEVQVTVEPSSPSITPEEWKAWVLSTAGSVTDPTFRRHEQGDFEAREELP